MFKKENVVLLPTNQKAGCIIKTSDNVLVYQQNPYLVEGETLNHLYFTSNEEIKEGDYLLVEEHLKPLKFRYYMSNGDIECNNGLAYINEKCKKIIATTDTYLKIPDFPELENTAYRNLPQPSQGFINIFIEEYNKGNIITEVMVEYNDVVICESVENYDDNDIYLNGNKVFSWTNTEPLILESKKKELEGLKINPKDNTITIRKVKTTYSQQEVDDMLSQQAAATASQILEKFKGYKSREEIIELIKLFADHCEQDDELICYEGRDSLGNKILKNCDIWIKENL